MNVIGTTLSTSNHEVAMISLGAMLMMPVVERRWKGVQRQQTGVDSGAAST